MPDVKDLPDPLPPNIPRFAAEKPGVKISPIGFVFGIGALLILGIAAWLTFGPKPAPPPQPVLTAEARQYLPTLGIENVRMQASESYANQRVIEVLGDIKNNGNRTIKQALVTCRFRDWGGQIVAQENDYMVGGTAGSLAPGGTKPFRLAFDTIPDSWSQERPTCIFREIKFQ